MSFEKDILTFNGMYRLPVATHPTLTQLGVSPIERLKAFKSILAEELNEIDDIIVTLEKMEQPDNTVTDPEVLTMIADLLGDIQVYCASEMTKFGLPVGTILAIIMQSNFSKMGADGQPIYDERGKLLKGPNYWKPEPKIKAYLTALRSGEPVE